MRYNNYYNAEGYHDPTAGAVLAAYDRKERSDRRKVIRKQNRASGTKNRRPIVYICSPYSGDTVRNILAAQKYCRYAVSCGCIPFAPHLLFPQFLDDEIPAERKQGLEFGNIFMDISKEVWIFGDTLSDGMKSEYDRAARLGYKIRRFSAECIEQTGSEGGADGWV